MTEEKAWIFRFCSHCGKKFTDKPNMEFIKKTGYCASCDHVYAEILADQIREAEKEQEAEILRIQNDEKK